MATAKNTDAAHREQQGQAALLDEPPAFTFAVADVECLDEVAHRPGRGPQRGAERDDQPEGERPSAGLGEPGQLVGEDLLGIGRQRLRPAAHLVGGLVRVGHQAVEDQRGRQRRDERQEREERHAGREQ